MKTLYLSVLATNPFIQKLNWKENNWALHKSIKSAAHKSKHKTPYCIITPSSRFKHKQCNDLAFSFCVGHLEAPTSWTSEVDETPSAHWIWNQQNNFFPLFKRCADQGENASRVSLSFSFCYFCISLSFPSLSQNTHTFTLSETVDTYSLRKKERERGGSATGSSRRAIRPEK